jgi:hypothetical protein
VRLKRKFSTIGHHNGTVIYFIPLSRERSPIESVMAKLDGVKTNIPEQTYIEMSNELMRAHREKKRRRPNQ